MSLFQGTQYLWHVMKIRVIKSVDSFKDNLENFKKKIQVVHQRIFMSEKNVRITLKYLTWNMLKQAYDHIPYHTGL